MLALFPSLLLGATLASANPILQARAPAPPAPPAAPIHPETCEFSFGTKANSFKSDFTKIVTFGDSSTDSGKGFELSGGTAPPSTYFNHAWSNGPVYPVLLSERLGVDLLGCAIAGSTSNNTRAPGALNGLPVASAIEQVASYLGALAPDEKIDTRLHVLLTGQNNIRSNPVATGADATEDIVYAVGKLTDAGATRILLFTPGDIGSNTPSVYNDPSLASYLTAWSVSGRDSLLAAFPMASSLLPPPPPPGGPHPRAPAPPSGPNPNVAVVDTWALNKLLDVSAAQFGFQEDNKGQPCLVNDKVANTTTICEDPEKRQFWDGLHPSGRAHDLIAAASLRSMMEMGWVSRI